MRETRLGKVEKGSGEGRAGGRVPEDRWGRLSQFAPRRGNVSSRSGRHRLFLPYARPPHSMKQSQHCVAWKCRYQKNCILTRHFPIATLKTVLPLVGHQFVVAWRTVTGLAALRLTGAKWPHEPEAISMHICISLALCGRCNRRLSMESAVVRPVVTSRQEHRASAGHSRSFSITASN